VPHALVTGATGMVGSYIVERLLADGWAVRALVREPPRAEWLTRLGVALHPGDTLDSATFLHAASKSDVIFHAAAAIMPRGGWSAYRANIEGTRNAIEAARGAGARLLHVSSVAVYGPSARFRRDGRRTDEETPLAPLPSGAHYARSKRESESAVLDAHRQGRVWATAIRPDVIYGRRDRQFVPRTARLFSRGLAPAIGDGSNTLAIVHAASVADGAVRAAASDAAGGRAFNVANDHDITLRDFVRFAASGLGRPIRLVRIPRSVARAGVAILGLAAGLVGAAGRRAMLASSVDFLSRDNPFTSERARRELGWTPPLDAEEGVVDAFGWWKAQR
jgi:nucleoside-diphosphate-sugar epimerase